MKKYIIFLFIFGFIFSVASVGATVSYNDLGYTAGDVDPNPNTSSCVSLSTNMRYQSRDANTNGEVSTLQDFLQSQGYLNSEPTGYFGLLTFKAVKSFQSGNNINPTGYVGPITRAKINSLTCNGTDAGSTLPPVSKEGCTVGYNPNNPNGCRIEGNYPYPPGCTSNVGYSYTTGKKCNETVMCTMDAKQCPDGSYVGRTGPKCEFAKCPTSTNPPTCSSSSGYDTTTGFRCGCTSTSGYSYVDGTACDGDDNVCSPLPVMQCTVGQTVVYDTDANNCRIPRCAPLEYIQSPQISYLSPNYGSVSTQVTVKGSGFTSTGNKIKFGDLGSQNNPNYNLNSSDGKTLVFNVPSSNYMSCWYSSPACMTPAYLTQPGTYAVSVTNSNGTSNAVNFTVTTGNTSSGSNYSY